MRVSVVAGLPSSARTLHESNTDSFGSAEAEAGGLSGSSQLTLAASTSAQTLSADSIAAVLLDIGANSLS